MGQAKVSPKASKKQILLDFFQARGKRPLEVGDLRAARNELRRHLGPGDRTSLGYIASILREAGYEVRYEDRYSDPVMPEPYASRLKGVLEFHDLASAEQSLLRLDAIFREYSSAADRLGATMVRALVKKGKLRARSLAANPRVQRPEAPGKTGNRALVSGVAGDSGPFRGLAGAAKIFRGIPPTLRRRGLAPMLFT